jgi:hypothetical protein
MTDKNVTQGECTRTHDGLEKLLREQQETSKHRHREMKAEITGLGESFKVTTRELKEENTKALSEFNELFCQQVAAMNAAPDPPPPAPVTVPALPPAGELTAEIQRRRFRNGKTFDLTQVPGWLWPIIGVLLLGGGGGGVAKLMEILQLIK